MPTGTFVAGLVRWYLKFACTPAGNCSKQFRAVTAPELMTVANAVTGAPMVVVRAVGNADETMVVAPPGLDRTRMQPLASTPPNCEQMALPATLVGMFGSLDLTDSTAISGPIRCY